MIFVKDISPLIINLPIIITLIAFVRYIIGFKTWKNYTAVALALSYYFVTSSRPANPAIILIWFVLFFTIIGGALLIRYLIKRLSINYYSRYAFMYLGATFALFIVLTFIQILTNTSLFKDTSFIVGAFLIGTTIDDLATLHFKKDFPEFLRRAGTGLVLGFIGGLLLTWSWWNNLIYQHQEILIVVLVIDIIAASWSNIRVTELFRFKPILKS